MSQPPQLQKRLLTPLLSKKVPPVPPEEGRPLSPDRTANFFSRIFFSWFFAILKVGYKRTLEPNDLFALTDQDKVGVMADRFMHYYNHYLLQAQEAFLVQRAKDRELSRQNQLTVAATEIKPNPDNTDMSPSPSMSQSMSQSQSHSQSHDSQWGESRDTSLESERQQDLDEFEVPATLLFKTMFMTFRQRYSLACVFVFLSNIAGCTSPLLTKRLIQFVEEKAFGLPVHNGTGVGYAIGTVLMVYFSGVCINHGFHKGMFVGAQVRAVLIRCILNKSFRLSPAAKHDFPNSKITSMMGTDASRIDFALGFQPFLVSFPGPFITIIVILIVNLGVSALVGIAMLIVYLMAMAVFSKYLLSLRALAQKYTDKRVNYIKEILNNLKIIKYYSWEDAYFKNISEARGTEMDIINKMQMMRNLTVSGAINLSLFSSMVAFLVLYAVGSGKRTPANIFSSISLFNNFTNLVFMLPLAISSLSDATVGVRRIANFLNASEFRVDEGLVTASPETMASMDKTNTAIAVTNATFEWELYEVDEEEAKKEAMSKDERKKYDKAAKKAAKQKAKEIKKLKKNGTFVMAEKSLKHIRKMADPDSSFPGLNHIEFQVGKGEFVVITGVIGSGKSSLLHGIAGFMKRVGGSVDINGSLVLCGQPWIENTTVKENILFGSELDHRKYRDIVYACSLESDLQVLPAGDRTEIGERGITLSGGQKARINLARAVYADRDIVLLDDVLSAVDARVGKHIMQECILGLLKHKTRILATHQLSLIGAADRVFFLNGDGSMSAGTVAELQATNDGFRQLMAFSADTNPNSDDDSAEKLGALADTELEIKDELKTKDEEAGDEEAVHRQYNLDANADGQLIAEESQAVNGVAFSVYLTYFKLGKGFFKANTQIPAVLVCMALSTFCYLFTNTWLSFWTEYKFKGHGNGFYIGIYVMFTILSFVTVTMVLTLVGYVNNRASAQLNIAAIEKMLHAPMAYLDVTPMGRILNRFTKDTDVLDNELSDEMRFLIFMCGNLLGIIILNIIYLPWFAIAVVPFLFVAYVFAEVYQSSAREIKRIEAVQRSFVYNNFNECLAGMDTIKAYQAQPRFLAKNDYYTDRMDEAYYLVIAAQRWAGINLELVACALPLIVTILTVFRVFNINASSTGLVVSYVISIAGQVAFLVRIYTQVEVGMNSTERLFEYAFELDQEAAYTRPETDPSPQWPQHGAIAFNGALLAYRPGLPLVLKNLQFAVQPREKIGICGRTGAGKSSIMTALYRLSELSSGSITIDGVDIANLGLKALRSKLSIIPQDPVLFRGSIRKNLDPFGERNDRQLWDALRRAGLIDADKLATVIDQVENHHKFHLDQEVEDDGTNFSLGERQLLALARALVRESKILILDEATSSVDYETDAKIQATIASEFANCTILCIAHRLKTIVNYDRILVLDRGEIKEFDTPWALFNVDNGIFQQMCQRSNITADDFQVARDISRD